MSFSLDTLTEGIKARNVGKGNRRLLEKWGRTGLLRGLEATNRENMATLLENQAGQALREAGTEAQQAWLGVCKRGERKRGYKYYDNMNFWLRRG